MMRNAAHVLYRTVIEELPCLLSEADTPKLLMQSNIVGEILLELIPLRIAMWAGNRPFRNRMRLGLVHQVSHPSRNRLHDHLRTFAFEEIEHVEVAITLGDLGPELARNLHHRLHLGAVNFNL